MQTWADIVPEEKNIFGKIYIEGCGDEGKRWCFEGRGKERERLLQVDEQRGGGVV